ncbi:MAG: Undecaprenyl-diphosphatase [Ignavibacteria bacterium]|nr:Undecaprenyl-diphosphatase [Ignavibacteria bacterium]
MTILQAILLGILQGLTEFLPISSTAHLTLAGKYLGLIDPAHPEAWTAFIATIQLGTMLAVIFYFANEIREIASAFTSENFTKRKQPFKIQSQNSKMGWYVILGTIPVVIVGLLLSKVIEGGLTKSLPVIATSLIVLGLLLALAEKTAKFTKKYNSIKLKDALLIGLAQCLALIPGASRSGTTITAGLFLGLERESAARFSFLLSIPAVFASGIYEFYKTRHFLMANSGLALVVATVVSALSGYIAIAFLLRYLRTRTSYIFVIYRILLGVAILGAFILL